MRSSIAWPALALCLLVVRNAPAQRGAAWPDLRSFTTFPLLETPDRSDLRGAPTRVDLSGTVPVPGDQFTTNTCTGWAVAYGVCSSVSAALRGDTAFREQVTPSPDRVFSPAFLYALALEQPGCDADVFLSNALKMAADSGCCTWADLPFDTTRVEHDCRTVPIGVRDKAAHFRLGSATALGGYSANAIRQQLAAGNLVVFSACVEDHFDTDGDEAGGERPFTWHPVGFSNRSHAMLCMGYDDGDHSFLVQNSWGLRWGYHGTFRMPYAVAERYVTEAFAVPPVPSALPLVALVPSDTALHLGRRTSATLSEGESVRHQELRLLAADITEGADSLMMNVHDDDTGALLHRLALREDQSHTIFHEGRAYRVTYIGDAESGRAARMRIKARPQERDRELRMAMRNSLRLGH